MSELVPEQNGGYDLSSIGLKLTDPDLPFSEFENLCWMLGRFHEAVRFAIGDAILIGEKMFGHEAFQAFEQLHVSEEGMREYARVSEKVPRARRRKDLSWSHHRAVAALEPPDQKQWLKEAAEKNLSHHALRDALRGSPGLPRSAAARAPCRCCGRPYSGSE